MLRHLSINSSIKLVTAILFFVGAIFFTQLPTQAIGTDAGFRVFFASLQGGAIVPQMVNTPAGGGAGATLRGNRLRVTGSFANLTGGLRDFVADPVVPANPNVTSAVHIHRGAVTENGPVEFSLRVAINPGGRSGSFSGEYDLNAQQIQALMAGRLYIDLHTTTNRGGELRGVLQPM